MYFIMDTIIEGINKNIQDDDNLPSTYHSDSYQSGRYDRNNRDVEVMMNQSYGLPQPAFSRHSGSNSGVYSIIVSYPIWLLGIVYIIPGLFGLLSALLQKKGLYITSIVFSIISLLIMAALALVSFLTIFYAILMYGAVSSSCYDQGGYCKCGNEELKPFKSCSFFMSVFSMALAIMAFILIAWIALMVMFIICCYYTCCAKSGVTGGVVLAPAQQPMIPLEGDPNAATYTQQTYNYPPPQQYYDQSIPSKV